MVNVRPGFGLAEVVCAMLIFAIGALGAAGMIAHAARTAAHAERREWMVRRTLEIADSLRAADVLLVDSIAERGVEFYWQPVDDRHVDVSAALGQQRFTLRVARSP